MTLQTTTRPHILRVVNSKRKRQTTKEANVKKVITLWDLNLDRFNSAKKLYNVVVVFATNFFLQK